MRGVNGLWWFNDNHRFLVYYSYFHSWQSCEVFCVNFTDMLCEEERGANTDNERQAWVRVLHTLAAVTAGKGMRLSWVSTWFYWRPTVGPVQAHTSEQLTINSNLDCVFCSTEMTGLGSRFELTGTLGGSGVQWLQHRLCSQAELLEESWHHCSTVRGLWPSHWTCSDPIFHICKAVMKTAPVFKSCTDWMWRKVNCLLFHNSLVSLILFSLLLIEEDVLTSWEKGSYLLCPPTHLEWRSTQLMNLLWGCWGSFSASAFGLKAAWLGWLSL